MRVMTWNLWWRFGPFEQRLPAIIDTIRSVDPDIVCLQEVWSDGERDIADELAAALGMHAIRTDPVMWNGESFGNAVLSRWPAERIASLRYIQTGPDYPTLADGPYVEELVRMWATGSLQMEHICTDHVALLTNVSGCVDAESKQPDWCHSRMVKVICAAQINGESPR